MRIVKGSTYVYKCDFLEYSSKDQLKVLTEFFRDTFQRVIKEVQIFEKYFQWANRALWYGNDSFDIRIKYKCP